MIIGCPTSTTYLMDIQDKNLISSQVFVVGSVLLIFFVFCILCFALFVLCPLFTVFQDCPFVIVRPVGFA